MTKPTDLPLWATIPDAAEDQYNIEPTEPQKEGGWSEGRTAPAPWFNWWMNLVYLWIVWLNDFESTVHTWSAAQTFHTVSVSNNFNTTGTADVTFGSSLRPLFSVGLRYSLDGILDVAFDYATVAYSKIAEKQLAGSSYKARLYWATQTADDKGWVMTENAKWDQTLDSGAGLWVRDDPASDANFFLLSGVAGFVQATSPAAAGTPFEHQDFFNTNATFRTLMPPGGVGARSVLQVANVSGVLETHFIEFLEQAAPVALTLPLGFSNSVNALGATETLQAQRLTDGQIRVHGLIQKSSAISAGDVIALMPGSFPPPPAHLTFFAYNISAGVANYINVHSSFGSALYFRGTGASASDIILIDFTYQP